MDRNEIIGIIENVLFAVGDAVETDVLSYILDVPVSEIEEALEEENARRAEAHGLIFRRFDRSVQLSTRDEYADYIVKLLGEKKAEELSKATMETLSIIAYKQPVTRDEIEKIRGVSSSYTVGALLDKDLIEVKGRKDTIGRPKLYGTTENFLRYFNIRDLSELPELREEEQETLEEEII